MVSALVQAATRSPAIRNLGHHDILWSPAWKRLGRLPNRKSGPTLQHLRRSSPGPKGPEQGPRPAFLDPSSSNCSNPHLLMAAAENPGDTRGDKDLTSFDVQNDGQFHPRVHLGGTRSSVRACACSPGPGLVPQFPGWSKDPITKDPVPGTSTHASILSSPWLRALSTAISPRLAPVPLLAHPPLASGWPREPLRAKIRPLLSPLPTGEHFSSLPATCLPFNEANPSIDPLCYVSQGPLYL